MNRKFRSDTKKQHGFTLIEVMLVIVLMGIFITSISITRFGNQPEEKLEQEIQRFVGVFNLASEYGLLNNIELGLLVTDSSYQFLGFDGVSWQPIVEQSFLTEHQIHQDLKLTLELEDLPIENNSLFSSEGFLAEDDDGLFENKGDFRDDTEKKKIIPQIYLFSGGDFTSFKLIFSFQKDIEQALDVPIEYHVLALFTLPLKTYGPLYDGEEYDVEN